MAREVIAQAVKNQRLKIRGMTIPYDVGLDVGTSWGITFPFTLNQETGEIYEPDGEFVNKGEHEKKDEKVEDYIEDFDFDFDMEDM